MNYTVRETCRLCSDARLTPVLKLEDTPLANEFAKASPAPLPDELFPLYLVLCEKCRHIQLPVVVDPARLFSNYVYVSGTSPSFVNHFSAYAREMYESQGLQPGDLVVEIGSNDGTMLSFFKELGCRVVGIDPAVEIASAATKKGMPTYAEFFDGDVAEKILREYGQAKLVVANNVFAHADHLGEITKAVKTLLVPDSGKFVIEVQYLSSLIKDNLFDMIYHEHLSYHSVEALIPFFEQYGMHVEAAQDIATHGGSIRVRIGTNANAIDGTCLAKFVKEEHQLITVESFGELKAKIISAREELTKIIDSHDGRILGYGAPAKLTTLLYQLGLQPGKIEFVVDDNPLKQGLLTPGLHIPVISSEEFLAQVKSTDRIIIFAWNFAEQIAAKFKNLNGQFIVPLPFPRPM
ncbi:AdoMet_MTases domain containing protein [Oxalobacteraceae bacterium]